MHLARRTKLTAKLRWIIMQLALLCGLTTIGALPAEAVPTTQTAIAAAADFSNPAGTIYYTYAPGTTLKAWGFAVGDTQPVRLTASPSEVEERDVSVSPDGAKVAVVYSPQGAAATQWGVAIYDRGAAQPNWTVTLNEPQKVTWSPDGQSIAVVSGPGGGDDPQVKLEIYAADGSGEPKLLARSTEISYVAWSPDSSRVAAKVVDWGLSMPWGISLYNADGSGSQRLAIGSDMPSSSDTRIKLMSWTADGSALIYFRNSNSGPQLVRQAPTGSPEVLTPKTELYQRAPVMWGPWLMGHVASKPTFLNVETGETRSVDVPTWQLGAWDPSSGATPPPVNEPPAIDSVSLADQFVNVAEEVNLLVSGLSDPDGRVTSVKTTWGTGEGTTFSPVREGETELRYIKHTYNAPGSYAIETTAYDDDQNPSSTRTVVAYVSRVTAEVTRSPGANLAVHVDARSSELARPGVRIEVDHNGTTTTGDDLTATVPVAAKTGNITVRVISYAPETTDEVELGSTTVSYDIATPEPEPRELDGVVYGVRSWPLLAGTQLKALQWQVGSDSGLTRVTDAPMSVREHWVSVAPDNARVAVVQSNTTSAGHNGGFAVAVYRIGAAEPEWLRSTDAKSVNWSPDGRMLAIVEVIQPGVEERLLLLNADGSGPVRELSRLHSINRVSWSPDGEEIAMSGHLQSDSGTRDLFIVDTATRARTSPRAVQLPPPCYSPCNFSRLTGPLGWDETGSELTYAVETGVHDGQRWQYEVKVSRLLQDGRVIPGPTFEGRLPMTSDQPRGDWFAGSFNNGAANLRRDGFLNASTGEAPPLPEHARPLLIQDWGHSPGNDVSGTAGPRITVTTTSDNAGDPGCAPAPGDCTLREAIEKSNDSPLSTGTPVIDLPDTGGPIRPTSPLPTILTPVVIVGSGTPEGVTGSDNRIDGVGAGVADGCATAPVIIDGSLAGAGAEGLRVRTGLNTRRATLLHGLILTRFGGDGVSVANSRKVRFQCGSSTSNGGAGIGVHDSQDIAAVGEVALTGNGADGLRVTGASWRVRSWGGSITANGGLAVDLRDDGVTGNDVTDSDAGPNALVNHPVLERVADDPDHEDPMRLLALVRLPLGSEGRGRVDLYRNSACDTSGHGELGTWIAGAITNLGTSGGQLLAIPFRDGGSGPLAATLVSGAGMSEASPCVTTPILLDPPPDTTLNPIRTWWPNPDGTTGGGSGTSQPGDPGGGAGDGGTYGGDVPPTTGTSTQTGPTGIDDPADGVTGTPPVPPTFDVGNHLVLGDTGTVSVEPAPGVLDDVVGGLPPYRVEKVAGGDLPDARWSVHPLTGAVTLDAVGLPAGGYNGRFRVRDQGGELTPVRDIAFVVSEPGEPVAPPLPFVTVPDRYNAIPGQTLTIPTADGVLANDQAETALTAARATGGTLAASRITMSADGAFTLNTIGLAEGDHTFLYRATTTDGLVSPATLVTVAVDNGNQCPTARDDTWDVISGEQFSVDAALGALANDTDRENDSITGRLIGSFSQRDISFAPNGSVSLDARGDNPGSRRAFAYRAVDSKGESCGSAQVTLNIKANQPPVVNENVFTVAAGRRFTLSARGLLGNDLDPDGPELGLTSRIVNRISGLTISTDGSLVYNAPLRRGTYTATYRAIDQMQGSTVGSVTFRVVRPSDAPPVNRAPLAADDTFYRVHADSMLLTTATDGVLANDSDPDGDEIYAEPMTTASRTRFPLLRDGSFLFRPRMADVGRTLTFRYRAIEKGYAAAMSPIRTATIQVVPPRERCRTIRNTVQTEVTAADGHDTLAATAAGFGWCWDERTITRVGTLRGDGGFDSSTRTAGSVAGRTEANVEPTWTFLVEGQAETVNHSTTVLHPDALQAQLITEADYRTCINPSEIAIQILAHITRLKAIPGAEKLLRKVLKASLLEIASNVQKLAKAANNFLTAVNVGGVLVHLAKGLDDDGIAAPLVSLIKTIENAQVTVQIDGEHRTLPILEGLREALHFEGAVVTIKNTLTCLPLGAIPGLGDASATHQIKLVPDAEFDSGELTGVDDGFFTLMARWRRIIDLFDQSDVSIRWRTEQDLSDTVYVGCDYTRTRPEQAPFAPPQLPGDSPRTC